MLCVIMPEIRLNKSTKRKKNETGTLLLQKFEAWRKRVCRLWADTYSDWNTTAVGN